VILSAGYILWMIQRVFHGEVTNPKNAGLKDLSLRETAVIVPLIALAILMGLLSPYFTRAIEPAASVLVHDVGTRRQPPPASAPEEGVRP
jgi:NADH-quinone oxidoreductase subunit M